MKLLLIGLGAANEPVARHAVARGLEVVVVDDHPDGPAQARADALGVELASGSDLGRLVGWCDVVIPGPGVPAAHPARAAAARAGRPVWSEFELAARWGTPPMVAVTGTNGKTTVTTMVAAMLGASGRRAVACGNLEPTLVDALDLGADVLVVEASSFRLHDIDTWRPDVAVWLNFAPDHLDWHPDLEHYADAKARIWERQRPEDLAIANAEDPVVATRAASAPGRTTTFGVGEGEARVVDGRLVAAGGVDLVAVEELPRSFPHDIANALAAATAALAAGAGVEHVRSVLESFVHLHHRVELIGQAGGVRWWDDSKSTTPASTLAALRGFDDVVLIAGGRNKGLDLAVLAQEAGRVRAVVAIGEAAAEVSSAFDGRRPVRSAETMDEAVTAAAELARGSADVLLSPACASFDWYSGYAARGRDFARAVAALEGVAP